MGKGRLGGTLQRTTASTTHGGMPPPTSANANHQHLVGQLSPVNAYPKGQSAVGCWDLLGNVWEWTADWFAPYDGFNPYPYTATPKPTLISNIESCEGGVGRHDGGDYAVVSATGTILMCGRFLLDSAVLNPSCCGGDDVAVMARKNLGPCGS